MRLGGVRWLSGGGRSRNGTHHLLLTTHILRASQRVMMDAGDTGVRNVILDIGSDEMGIRDIVASGGDGCVRVCCKFPLEFEVSTRLDSNDGTHVKDLKNLVEVRPPGGDLLSVVHRMESPGECVPLTPLY